MDIPVKLSVELGRTRITIKQLLELAQGSVVELDGLAGEPMDILINGYLIAQGEVVVLSRDDDERVRALIRLDRWVLWKSTPARAERQPVCFYCFFTIRKLFPFFPPVVLR